MRLNELSSNVRRNKKRVGRGESSGKGKTSGRGMKGQKARGKLPLSFEGGQLPIIKRLPFQRGVGNKRSVEKLPISLSALVLFKEGEKVTVDTLVEKGIVGKSDSKKKIKIVAGKIDKALVVEVPITNSAKEAVEKAKGSVTNV